MASFGQIVFYSMITLIILFATALIIFFAVAFSTQSNDVASRNTKPIGKMGEDEVLDCFLQSNIVGDGQFSQVSVTWEKKGLEGLVYHYEDGAPKLEKQASQFKGRVHLFPEMIHNGNASLMMRSVRRSDEGEYICHINSADASGKISIHLKAAAFTPPTFKLSEGLLTAVANRWFPKPNVTWLNETGSILNGSTTINQTAGGIFRVTSTLQQPHIFETYTCQIETSLVIAVGEATVTDTEVSQRTYYTYSLALSPLPSLNLNFMTFLIFICCVN